MGYRKKVLDLTNAFVAPQEIIPRNQVIEEIFFLEFPANTRVNLHFGDTSDPISVGAIPIKFKPTGDDQLNGLYWDNPIAAPGSSIVMYMSVGKLTVNPEGLGPSPHSRTVRGTPPGVNF